MRKPRGIASILVAMAALALIIAGPIMIYKGFDGQSQIRQQLVAQKIQFPAKGNPSLPANLQSYGSVTVTTGEQAKAYSDMVETHIMKTTGGMTYSQVSEQWMAGGMKDATLAQQRQTAFMGESLRSSLLSAYQAWQLTYLVIGLGALFTGLGLIFAALAYIQRPHRIVVPASPEVLTHEAITTS